MKTKNKPRKIRKYKSKKYKRKLIGGRDKRPILIRDEPYVRPDMKSFNPNDSSILEDMKISCDGVTNQASLLGKLIEYPYIKLTQPMTLVLFPYCNEEIKQTKGISSALADTFDLVNKPLLDEISLRSFETAFGNFEFQPTTELIVKHDNSVIKSVTSPPTNPDEFINFLKTYIAQSLNTKKGIFIVSHSGFMTSLMIKLLESEQGKFGPPDLYTDNYESAPNIAFDNLDMIHLQYDKHQQLFLNITIRRHRYKYNLDTNGPLPTESNIQHIQIENERECPVLNIFIMRHCLACHNLSNSLSEKASQYMFNTKGYLNYALCLRKTCFDLLRVKNQLLHLFKIYCFFNQDPKNRLSEIVFGSSVLFRSILTCSLVFNSLTRKESTTDEIEQLKILTTKLPPKTMFKQPNTRKRDKKIASDLLDDDVFDSDDEDDLDHSGGRVKKPHKRTHKINNKKII
jgi:hypothetical protein